MVPSDALGEDVFWIVEEAELVLGFLANLTGLAYPLPRLAFLNGIRVPFWGYHSTLPFPSLED